jgi:hypothetical protein
LFALVGGRLSDASPAWTLALPRRDAAVMASADAQSAMVTADAWLAAAPHGEHYIFLT